MADNGERDAQMQEDLNAAEVMAGKFIGKISWKIMLLRSIASIAAGTMVFAWPLASLVAIAMVIGVYFIFNGVMAVSAAFALNKGKLFMFFYGLLCIFAGSIAFKNPLFTDMVIMLFVGVWAIFSGFSELGVCLKMHGGAPVKFLMGFTGIVSLIFGVLVLFNLKTSLGMFVWIAGFYFLMTGFSMLFLAFSLKGIQDRIKNKANPAV